ncbi:hypothetical protein [Actinoplanes derwentensis]|uniref:hypothetical protein n=1 Tax=Actinoplanes derwentensis TaxID=113562 RepID=UPI0012FD1161|nr:hypothetical protein [Actinoplanes derwentensis]
MVRKSLAVVMLAGCGGLLVWMFFGRAAGAGLVGNSNVVGGIAGLAAFAVSALAVWPRKSAAEVVELPAAAEGLLAAEGYLARETLAYWREQAKRRRITTPAPARVSWQWAGPDVAAPPSEVAGDESVVALLSDRVVSQLRRDLYEVLPVPGRIVILGGPGAGKTTAMLLLLIDVLAARADAGQGADEALLGPVPAWLTLGGWDPDAAGLLDYAASVLNRDYPGLAAHAGPGTASELLRSGRIALFLDGLDEMPDGVRGPALEAIDRTASRVVRVVVTSRPDEYQTGSELHRLWDAAVIEVQPVDLEHACEFLLFQQTGARRAEWETVTDHMRSHPDGVTSRTLRNPLALGLARDIYTHTDATPQALLGYPNSDALLKHLLIRSLAVAYPDPDERAQAVRWLSWIAKNLGGHRDIHWWEICELIANADPNSQTLRNAIGRVARLTALFVGGPVGGIGKNPAALILRRPTRQEIRNMMVTGVWYGLGAGLGGGLIVNRGLGLGGGVAIWLVVGIGIWLSSSLYDLLSLWSQPLPAARTAAPGDVFTEDRERAIVFGIALGGIFGILSGLVAGVVVGLLSGFAFGLVFGSIAALVVGSVAGFVFGLGPAVELAWMERFLALRGVTVRFMPLLQTALEKQVLRQAGAVYQFRHAALQDLLAATEPVQIKGTGASSG